MANFSEEYANRLHKLTDAQKAGVKPYPAQVNRTHTIEQVLAEFDSLIKNDKLITLVGRIRAIRLHGGSCFAHLEDGSGKMQIYLKLDEVGDKTYEQFKAIFDIGDFIETSGSLFTTKRGEKTLLVKKLRLISKTLQPLPEKWHGLSDIEIRYRQRYLDLIANPEVSEIFKKRAAIVKTIRKVLDEKGFLEVETPILQHIPGGANAEPFVTHHHALNIDLYLRIAPELYLKRLIVGGFEKVYEIARCFRNEGIDRDHNPEFTQVEFYAAYWDYLKMISFTEELIKELVEVANGKLTIEHDNAEVNFTPPYERITFNKLCQQYAKINIDDFDEVALRKEAKARGVEIDKTFSRGKTLDAIFKMLIRPNIIKPTFVIDYPIELSPLAKKKEDNPNYVERFQLLAAGTELCNAFSELNDPLDQEERFTAQEKMRKAGDKEAQRIDHDYIEAMRYGMPPTAGIGIGIDRLATLLCGVHNVKEVILFPTLKPKRDD
jgi:lysyl-tRNA synthetase, class II